MIGTAGAESQVQQVKARHTSCGNSSAGQPQSCVCGCLWVLPRQFGFIFSTVTIKHTRDCCDNVPVYLSLLSIEHTTSVCFSCLLLNQAEVNNFPLISAIQ